MSWRCTPLAGPCPTRYSESLQQSSIGRHDPSNAFHDQSIREWMSPIETFKSSNSRMTLSRRITRADRPVAMDRDYLVPSSTVAFTDDMELSTVVPPTELIATRSSSFEYVLYASMMLRSGVDLDPAVCTISSTEPDNLPRSGNDRTRTSPRIVNLEDGNAAAASVGLKRKAVAGHAMPSSVDTAHNKTSGCKCKKSKCLKLYCECFAGQSLCSDKICKCLACSNMFEHNEDRHEAVQNALRKDALIFEKQIRLRMERRRKMLSSKSSRQTTCRCKKSRCIMRYCECFFLGAQCNQYCGCTDCRNHDE
jgi:hypothetical protein